MPHCSIQEGCSLVRPHPFPLPLQAQAKSDDEAYDRAAEEAAMKKKKKRDPSQYNIEAAQYGFLDR